MTDDIQRPRRDQTVADYRLEQVELALKEFRSEIRESINGLAGRYVSSEIYAIGQKGNDDRHIRAEERISNLEADQIERDKFARGVRVQGAFVAVSSALAVIALILNVIRG